MKPNNFICHECNGEFPKKDGHAIGDYTLVGNNILVCDLCYHDINEHYEDEI